MAVVSYGRRKCYVVKCLLLIFIGGVVLWYTLGVKENGDVIRRPAYYNHTRFLFHRDNFKPSSAEMSTTFVNALKLRADSSNFIILAMFDESFADMAANMYEFSFRSHDIDNFLFVGVGRRACALLAAAIFPASTSCHHFQDDPADSEDSSYGTEDFIRKMNIRTQMMMKALKADFTVLHTDVDVVFLANPVPELKKLLKSVDLAAMWDEGERYNAGFVMVRPSPAGILLYESTLQLSLTNTDAVDQVALNIIIEMARITHPHLIRQDNVITLDRQRFTCGRTFFELPSQYYGLEWHPLDDSCGGRRQRPCAVVVHNNWIIGKAAKVFRFHEHLMWTNDPNGSYYNGNQIKYLCYGGYPSTGGRWEMRRGRPLPLADQLSELTTALVFGQLLNRTVIVPRFRCSEDVDAIQDCSLISLVDMARFDEEFRGRYRESTFLVNPRVASRVRNGLSAVLSCRADGMVGNQSDTEIAKKYATFGYQVLVFDSFSYKDCYPMFTDRHEEMAFESKIKRAFSRS